MSPCRGGRRAKLHGFDPSKIGPQHGPRAATRSTLTTYESIRTDTKRTADTRYHFRATRDCCEVKHVSPCRGGQHATLRGFDPSELGHQRGLRGATRSVLTKYESMRTDTKRTTDTRGAFRGDFGGN